MLLVNQDRRRLVLIKALEIALGIRNVNDSGEALRQWSDHVSEFRQLRIDGQALLQHLKSGEVLVCALAQPYKAPADQAKAPA